MKKNYTKTTKTNPTVVAAAVAAVAAAAAVVAAAATVVGHGGGYCCCCGGTTAAGGGCYCRGGGGGYLLLLRSIQPQPSYSSGPCRSELIECSNCKVKDLMINRLESRNKALKARLRMLEARLEMERNPEDHACQSGAILNELLDDIEDLHME
ncbi:hypothetical protein Tco_0294885 [Tanacetum coccineum]